MTDAQRFAGKVLRGPGERDCWVWVGAIGDDGYGRFWTRREDGSQQVIRAHRFAFAQLMDDPALLDNAEVCHTCDNPLCVRAETGSGSHLYLGDRAQNMRDRADRGRGNTQHGAQLYRTQTRAERARRSRALRAHVLAHGYDAEAIATILGDLSAGQRTLW